MWLLEVNHYMRAPFMGTVPGVQSQLPDPSEFYALTRMPYSRMGYPPAPAGRMMPAPMTAAAQTTVTTTVTPSIAVSAAQTGLVYSAYTGHRALILGTYALRPGYGPPADHLYHISPMLGDPGKAVIYGYPSAGQTGVGAVGGVSEGVVGNPGPSGRPDQSSLSGELGAISRCRPATGGGYGTRPTEVRTSGYYGYPSVPTGVARVDQVDGSVGWTVPAAATGYRELGGLAGQTAPDGRRTTSNADTASWIPSVWAGIEPAKLYTGVGQSYMDAGAAGILQPAYPGQPIQLRPATPIQLANGQSLTQVRERLLRRLGIIQYGRGFKSHRDRRWVSTQCFSTGLGSGLHP